jgi:Ca2+-binding RTX toxin-like protein
VAPAISGYGNRYIVNGVEAPVLDLEFGKTYAFDLSDESTRNHPLLFRVKDAEGNTTILTDEVISTGTRGSDQKIYFTVPKDVEGTIEYYGERHANMGNEIGVTITNQVTDDLFSGSELSEAITAGEGADLIEAGSGEDTIYLFSSEVWTFPYFAQNIISGERLSLAGKTKFASVIDGEEDADTLNLTDSTAGDAFFLHDSYSGQHDSLTVVDDGMGRATVARAISLETINAGDGDDVIDLTSPTFDMGGISMTINGEAGDDTIWAAEGDDKLYGGDDDDTLFGGEGNDILTGGNGADIFEFKSSDTAQTDRITDYTTEDTLKFYLQSGESELSSANLSGGNLSWGNLTIDFGDTSITNLDDLNIAYDYI